MKFLAIAFAFAGIILAAAHAQELEAQDANQLEPLVGAEEPQEVQCFVCVLL